MDWGCNSSPFQNWATIPLWESLLAEGCYLDHIMLTVQGQHIPSKDGYKVLAFFSHWGQLWRVNPTPELPGWSAEASDATSPSIQACFPHFLTGVPENALSWTSCMYIFVSEPVSGKPNLRHLSLFPFCGDLEGHMFQMEQLWGGRPSICLGPSQFLTDHLAM